MSKYCMGCMEQYEDEFNVCPYCGYIEGTKPEQALHMEPGSILQGRFIVGKSIGYGGFGVTYIGWDALLEHRVAIKEYLPSEFSTRMPGVTQVTVFNGDKKEQFHDGLRQFVEEAKKLAKFNNVEGIVKIYDSFEENNTAYIVMEYLEGETLASRLEREKTIAPDKAVAMLTPVIESLEKVHAQGIIHRDIAPDNLFITKDGSVKVIDFGAARFATTSHSRSLTVIIKPGFSPEEQYRSRKEQGGYTDVYAIGATLYKMITGVTPPDALERYAMAESSNKDILEPISKYYKKIDQDQENAILNALNIRIEDRTPTMAAFLGELQSTEPVKRVYGRIKRTDTLRWPLWAKISVPVVTLALLIFGILFGTGVIGFKSNLQTQIQIPDGMTRVPSVVNNTTDVAETRLTEAVLLYTIAGKEYSAVVPANYVLSQDMTGGIIVQQNSIVNVIVSGGAETIAMPNVTNMPIDEAKAVLEEAGFVVSQLEEFSSAIEKGYVISQDVEADTEIAIGSVITLVVSKGVDPAAEQEKKEIEIPDLVGKTYDEVLAIAEANGFKLSISAREYSTEYAANEIMSQTPSAGSKIMTGETVNVVVSLGKNVVKVPDVQYQKKADAKATLEALGLKVTITEVESETIAAGLVISQSIAADTSVDPGTSITLTVSKGAGSFAMPNVVGMSEVNAKNTLTSKGLSVSVTYEYSSKVAGTVLKQSISENTQVTRGTSVTITVSSGEETVNVPNVVGQTSDAAEAALKNKGFAVTINKVYSDSVAAGKVISQAPGGGSSQVKGSTVIITVSLGKDTVQSISITAKPSKLSYFVGETLNPVGMSLTAKYKSGSTQTVTGGYACSPTELNAAGTQTITVTYEGCTATFDVTVSDIVLNSISIKSKPTKTSYFVGDTLNTTGLVLTASYSDGTTEEVTSGFTCTPTTLSTVGNQLITVKYYGKTATFSVTVKSVDPTGVSVKTKPSKTSYYVGDTLNTSGLVLTVTYNNGSSKEVTSGFTCSPTTLSTAGTQTITVKYEGLTTSFTVSVEAVLTGISIKTKPTDTSYYVQDTLDTNGLTLTATYNDGTTKTVSSGFSCTPTTLSTAGTQTITVEYKGKTTSLTVSVETVTAMRISIKKQPTKTAYYVGETLNTAGLTLTVEYNNGTNQTVSSGFTCSPTTLSTAGIQIITVTYGGKTTTFNVSVTKVTVTSLSIKTQPTKTNYYIGETLSTSGLTLTATYNNGTSQTISSGFTCSPTTLSSTGNKTITVSYGDATATFTVKVIADSIVNISSTSGSFTVLDTGVTITNSPSSVSVGKSVGISVSHTWDRTPKTFTVKTNSSATKITASSSDTGVVSVSVSQSNNVATITVTPALTDYNTTETATVYIYLNGEQKATYGASVYRPHSLTVTSSNSKLLYVKGNPFDGGKIWAVGTYDDPTGITSSNRAYLTVTTYNGNTAKCAITVTASSDYTPSETFNIRSGAGTGYSVIGTLPAGTTVKILGNYWDGTRIWGGIYYNGEYGWVAVYDFSG